MTTEDIERLSLEELQRMAEDPEIAVPEVLSSKLLEMACAASLVSKGTEALVDKPGATAPRWHPNRWLWGAIPAVTLAALAALLLLHKPQQPKDTFADPTLAYIEISWAFSIFSEAMQDISQPIENPQKTNGL